MNKFILVIIIIGLITGSLFLLYRINPQKQIHFPSASLNANSNLPTATPQVPLPSKEDLIRVFFDLINEKRIPEAIVMMDDNINKNDSLKQQWETAFNNWQKNKLNKIEPYNFEWTDTREIYKIELTLSLNPKDTGIWENGTNVRFIELNKQGNLWKIMGISTGP